MNETSQRMRSMQKKILKIFIKSNTIKNLNKNIVLEFLLKSQIIMNKVKWISSLKQ